METSSGQLPEPEVVQGCTSALPQGSIGEAVVRKTESDEVGPKGVFEPHPEKKPCGEMTESVAETSESEPAVQPEPVAVETDQTSELPPAAEPSFLDEVKQMQLGLAELTQDFRSKFQYDTHKNQTIDMLHAELQEYRNDLIRKLLRPMILDAIMIADDIRKVVSSYRAKDPEHLDPLKLLVMMEGMAGDLDNLLYRQGVDSFLNEGETFDPKRQKVLKRVPTEDPEKDKTVAERIRGGYQWDDRVIRPEMVAVHVYQPKEPKLGIQNEANKTEGHHESTI